ncbi:MAG: undecaprenyl-diphosphate phosphatase [Gemmatimonadetes bacterium]|nr:undecaprenyl-diphosphate phosphatase [Gemmatimonadota bacterium]
MSPLEAILLGVIQGITEFLPVSSSGHLVMAQALMGLDLPGVLFEIDVHLATLCAVCWVYRASLVRLAKGVFGRDRESLVYVGLLAIATVPAALVGVGLGDVLEPIFERPIAAAAFLLVTGALVWSIRRTARRADRDAPNAAQAIGIGCAQALAILPGISRSGSTLAAGTALGVEPTRMAEFSFLLSIPAIAGAAALQVPDLAAAGGAIGTVPLVVGFLAAALSGVVAIRIFLGMLQRKTFHRFAYYCWVVGLAYLGAATVWPGLR